MHQPLSHCQRNLRARNAFLAMGVTGILAGTMSRPIEMGEPDAQDPHGVH